MPPCLARACAEVAVGGRCATVSTRLAELTPPAAEVVVWVVSMRIPVAKQARQCHQVSVERAAAAEKHRARMGGCLLLVVEAVLAGMVTAEIA